jgi:hypothetical protein
LRYPARSCTNCSFFDPGRFAAALFLFASFVPNPVLHGCFAGDTIFNKNYLVMKTKILLLFVSLFIVACFNRCKKPCLYVSGPRAAVILRIVDQVGNRWFSRYKNGENGGLKFLNMDGTRSDRAVVIADEVLQYYRAIEAFSFDKKITKQQTIIQFGNERNRDTLELWVSAIVSDHRRCDVSAEIDSMWIFYDSKLVYEGPSPESRIQILKKE